MDLSPGLQSAFHPAALRLKRVGPDSLKPL